VSTRLSDEVTWANACTIGAATGSTTRSGDPIMFSNSDDPFTTRTRLVVVEPSEGYRFIATQIISPPPAVSFNDMHTRGLNEAGFAYTWAYVMPESEPSDREAIGIPLYQFGRLLLSQARTVADAINLVQDYPRAYHGNFLFADAQGEIALVEISTRSMHVETCTLDGLIARSNHWISEEMAPLGRDSVIWGESSHHRIERAQELLDEQRGDIDAQSLWQITADHAGKDEIGYSICAHGKEEHWGGTVSSEIIEPRRGRFWYCYGWPCGSQPESPEHQVYQDRSWGTYLTFDLDDLTPGEYVTTDGRLTSLGIKGLVLSERKESLAGAIR
jgi:hypothetical protein